MKVALICPSNLLYMPYVSNYKCILSDLGINYDLIFWDRFGIDGDNSLAFKDNKKKHQRNLFDYYKFNKFIMRKLKSDKYDKIIVFGLQLTFFISKYLYKKYKNKYVLDIRDYNKIIKFMNVKKVIRNSRFTVLSSDGYKEWLPISDKYIINHNTNVNCLEMFKSLSISLNCPINIAYIGALRDYNINVDFINALQNSNRYQLNYHGEGDVNSELREFIQQNCITNVSLTGRYKREEEDALYDKNSLINVLRYNDSLNNKTALPNRLYNSAVAGKPMIAFKGTYLADEIEKYNLGFSVDTFNNLDNVIQDKLAKFDEEKYDLGRKNFFEKVFQDNNLFKDELKTFLNL